MLIITFAVAAAGAVLCFALSSLSAGDILPISLGIVIFLIINIIRVYLLEFQVDRLTKMDDPASARNFAIGQGFIRFALVGAGLVIAAFLPFDNYYGLYAAIIAAFVWNIAVYALRFMKIDDDPN